MHPFRFGLQASKAPSAAAWRELARKTEALGFSTLFLPDHFEEQLGPLVGLAVAAEATTTLRVGSLVFGNDYRHPLVLAKEIATLDVMSEGRVEFGLGAGWMRSDYEQAGMIYDEPSVRVDRLEESIRVMKALWAGERVDFAGTHYTLQGALGWPSPYRTPHPTLLVGGGSPRVLSIAAREADIVGINPSLAAGAIGPEVIASAAAARVDERIAWVKDAAGGRFSSIELQSLTFFVNIVDNGAEARSNLAASFGQDPQQVVETPSALIGSVDEIVEKLISCRERWGLSYWVVHEAEMDAFAEVIGKLEGT